VLLAEVHYFPFYIEHPKALLAGLIGVALILFLFFRFGVPAFRGLLLDREARIAEAHNQVERQLADIQHLRNDYKSRIDRIEAETRERIDAAVREAEAARAEIIAEAHQMAAVIRQRGEEEIAREHTRQRILLRQQIVQQTLDAAEQAVRAYTHEGVQHQLIRDFIARAGKEGVEPAAAITRTTIGGA